MNNEMVKRACHAIGMDNKRPFTSLGRNILFPTEITLFQTDWGMSILTKWNLKDWQNQTVENSQLPII